MRIGVLGAAGGTGRQVVQQALDRGWEVAALARRPDALTITNERLSVTQGDAREPSGAASVVKGCDAVISVIGLRKGVDTSLSDATTTICAAMKEAGVRRLVVMSVLGIRDSADKAGIFGRVIIPLFMKKAVSDRVRVEEVVEASGLDYTLVRAARLVDGGPTGKYSAGPDARANATSKVTRGDVAHCLLDQAEAQGEHSRAIGVVG
ncbi:MAG TPA: NAD(P)H-binding protein [Solirubrobacteraceae bacterium]|nr:NAD(P)H-binding protein [Solirubrobacteraceae bacterium]